MAVWNITAWLLVASNNLKSCTAGWKTSTFAFEDCFIAKVKLAWHKNTNPVILLHNDFEQSDIAE